MIKFKDLITSPKYGRKLDFPSVEVKLNKHTLYIRFDSKDVVVDASYDGPSDPWLSSLCFLLPEQHLEKLLKVNWSLWEEKFREDEFFWELRQEESSEFIVPQFEILKASLEVYRGREYLYKEESPLICRCFGVRESDVLSHLKTEANPTIDTLAQATKASMGCRSCLPQLKRWLLLHDGKKTSHFFKERSRADWLVEIDYMLSCFPKAEEWKMEVRSFKENQVVISFDKKATQREEEETSKELQDFLRASLDFDLAFFLRSARHFS